MTVDSETWSPSDTEIIARAVIEAPSVHDTQPWNLRLPGSAAELEERLEFAEPGADPLRPDRLISCGTAVAHLELAMRVLGRQICTDLFPCPERPAVITRIETLGTSVPDSSDLRLYAAISHRKSHRDAFADIPVPAETIGDVVAAGVQVPVSASACWRPTRPRLSPTCSPTRPRPSVAIPTINARCSRGRRIGSRKATPRSSRVGMPRWTSTVPRAKP